jgi:hypothetical protein
MADDSLETTSGQVQTAITQNTPENILQPFITTSLDTINTQNTPQSTVSTQITGIPAPTSTIATQKPLNQASAATQALISIFSFLTSLLHNTQNQHNATPPLSSLLESVFTLISHLSGKKGADLDLYINDLKNECHIVLNRSIEELVSTPNLDEYKRPSRDEEKEAKTQAALCNVMTIASGVANIVQNPHDKVNVGQSVGSILSGIIGIALMASHKTEKQSLLRCCNAHLTVLHTV